MNFRISDLKNFIETSHCRTITEAAHRLGIRQPSLSQSLQRLESDLNGKLIYRSRTGIGLTPLGREILIRAESLFAIYLDITGRDREDSKLNVREVTIGCHPVVASYALPRALAQIQLIAPNYKIVFKHSLSRHIQNEIQQGKIDVGIVVNATLMPDLVVRRIASDEVAVWSSPNMQMNHRLICNSELHQTQYILRKWKNQPQNILHSDSLELIGQLAENSLGFAILPARCVTMLKLNLNRRKDLPSYKDQIFVVYRPEFGKTAYEKLILESLKSSLGG
jgi:DNA-binding transcriptional LysR family regulator